MIKSVPILCGNRKNLNTGLINSLLGRTGIGFLTTHDLDLASVCENLPLARNYHFRDHIQEGKLAFDYKIRLGISTTSNALLIMKEEGLPT